MKTIYYYQSFVGLEKALENITDIDVIIVSSIHFGKDNEERFSAQLDPERREQRALSDSAYIHLNDNVPTDSIFDKL